MLVFDNFSFPVPPPLDWSQAEANQGLVAEVADLISLRKSTGALQGWVGGSIINVSRSSKVGVILREESRDRALVVYNFENVAHKNYEISNPKIAGAWSVRFDGDAKAYSHLFAGACSSASKTVVVRDNGLLSLCVPPLSTLILSSSL